MTAQFVEVKLELGHRASLKKEPVDDGFTHDWSIFVRGPEGCNIQHFVEKVIFYLHDSFQKPKRVKKEPPYQVNEAGYAGFNMMIEVCFKNKEEPKRIKFDYDLYLHLEGPPIVNCRCEKLTFQNPTEEFRKKLMKGGAVALSGAASRAAADESSGPNHHVRTETEPYLGPSGVESGGGGGDHSQTGTTGSAGGRPTSSSKQPASSFNNSSSSSSNSSAQAQKASIQVPKKTLKTSGSSTNSKQSSQTTKEKLPEAGPAASKPFTDIFGTPIKTKPPPDQIAKQNKMGEINKEKSSKSSLAKSTTLSAASLETKISSNSTAAFKSSHKESKSSSHKSSKHSNNKELNKKKEVANPETKIFGSTSKTAPKSPPTDKRSNNIENTDATTTAPTKRRKRTVSAESNASRDSLTKSVSGSKKVESKARPQSPAVPPPPPPPPPAAKEKPSSKEPRKTKEKRQKDKDNTTPKNNSLSNNNSSSSRVEKMTKNDRESPAIKKEVVKETPEVIERVSTNGTSSKENNPKSGASLKNEGKKRKPKDSSTLGVKKDKAPPVTPPPPPPPPPAPEIKPEVKEDEDPLSSNESLASSSPRGMADVKSGPLATLISEMEEKGVLSPLSSDQESKSESEDEEPDNKRRRARRSERSSSKENRNTSSETPVTSQKVFRKTPSTNGNSRQDSPATPPHSSEAEEIADEAKKIMDHAYLNELKDLQEKIMSLKDRQHLQSIVDLIEETGLYQVSGASFDFDLCSLDKVTVQKLQNFLAVK